MKADGTKRRLTEFIRNELSPEADEFDADTRLVEEQIIDSLGIFQLVDFFESSFGVSIEPEQIVLENFESLTAIEALITSLSDLAA